MTRQFGDEEYAENLTNLAKYDYIEENEVLLEMKDKEFDLLLS
jgi:hypothetical protein